MNHAPAYVHSMFLTESYRILCVWNSFFKAGGASLLWNKNFFDSLTYDKNQPAKWFVIDKKPTEEGGRGFVTTYELDAFFAFHSINAYEDQSSTSTGGIDIVADISAYPTIDCLKHFYLDNMLSDSPLAKPYCDPSNTSARPSIRRSRLADISRASLREQYKVIQEFTGDAMVTPELPTINPAKATKKYRYVWCTVDSGKSTFSDSLVKYDVSNHETKLWNVHGQIAGEPIFVADPESEVEDAGVLLSVVLDGIEGKSCLLVLDAKTMGEVGRARADGVIGFGFHGMHVPSPRTAKMQVSITWGLIAFPFCSD